MSAQALPSQSTAPAGVVDWKRVALRALISRHLDGLEETRLVPERKVLYQFCARGHEVTQNILADHLTGLHDGLSPYYRGRPLLMALGLEVEEALSSTMMKVTGMSGGRDIGVVFNLPRRKGITVMPAAGGVGTQYTPACGWAQALVYRVREMKDREYEGSIAIVHGGDGSVATNGFWSALTIATTEKLPLLFYIEDNGYAISVPGDKQTPGANIAANLGQFRNLRVHDGDGTKPDEAAALIERAVRETRDGTGPVLLRLTLPRLSGHSGQDTQQYKPAGLIEEEKARDPLLRLRAFLVPRVLSEEGWNALDAQAKARVETALEKVLQADLPDPARVARYAFSERREDGSIEFQKQGGVLVEGVKLPAGSETPKPEATRINMVTAIRRTLEHEMTVNPRMLIFGEDVGRKGGVHAATLGMQERFGALRVFDTSLSEEGIIGRSVGMAVAGLLPVPEIQFRKYAEPATEQLNDCGAMRWRTHNRFAAPMVVRMPGGFFKIGDPWHSQTNEVQFVHAVGWRVAMPSNAEDAVGLLRSALRGNDPTIFFEHRAMLDAAWARRPYPGDDYVVPFGKARMLRNGSALTVVSWGAMVERCELAVNQTGADVELIDLRTLSPWDREAVLTSVNKTHRCLIVHEDTMTAGFGAEVAATLASECFYNLDAPIERLAMVNTPSPHSAVLLAAALPSVDNIAAAIDRLVRA